MLLCLHYLLENTMIRNCSMETMTTRKEKYNKVIFGITSNSTKAKLASKVTSWTASDCGDNRNGGFMFYLDCSRQAAEPELTAEYYESN